MPMRMVSFRVSVALMGTVTIQQIRISTACGEREPNARVAPTSARNAVPRHPIRREEKEFRDTTFRQGGADYRRRYGDRSGDRAGACAGRRERGGGGTTAGKAARSD